MHRCGLGERVLHSVYQKSTKCIWDHIFSPGLLGMVVRVFCVLYFVCTFVPFESLVWPHHTHTEEKERERERGRRKREREHVRLFPHKKY